MRYDFREESETLATGSAFEITEGVFGLVRGPLTEWDFVLTVVTFPRLFLSGE